MDVFGFEFGLRYSGYHPDGNPQDEYVYRLDGMDLSLCLWQHKCDYFNFALLGRGNCWSRVETTLEAAFVSLYEETTFNVRECDIEMCKKFQQSEIYKKMKELYDIKDILE